jgi:hypothetical protein
VTLGASMFRRSLAIALVVVFCSFLTLTTGARAQTDAATVLQSFITAVNNGDVVTAETLASPGLTITLPGGATLPALQAEPAGVQTIPPAFLPITIVSVKPNASGDSVDAVLRFGGFLSAEVQVHTTDGVIDNFSIVGPA